MVIPINLYFCMCIEDNRFSYYINFGVDRRYIFFYWTCKISFIAVYRFKVFAVNFSIVKLLEACIRKVEWSHSRFFTVETHYVTMKNVDVKHKIIHKRTPTYTGAQSLRELLLHVDDLLSTRKTIDALCLWDINLFQPYNREISE